MTSADVGDEAVQRPRESALLVTIGEAEPVVGALRVRLDAAAAARVPAHDTVLWLAPLPREPFVELTRAVWNAYPQCPPYGGRHAGEHPHLTIGDRRPVADLLEAEQVVLPQLPISARVEQVTLMAQDSRQGSWAVVTAFPLG